MQDRSIDLRRPYGSLERAVGIFAPVLVVALLLCPHLWAQSASPVFEPPPLVLRDAQGVRNFGSEELLQPRLRVPVGAEATLPAEEILPVDSCESGWDCCGCPPRPDDQFWYVSSRYGNHDWCHAPPDPQLRVWRRDVKNQRIPATLEDFYAADDPGAITCIYVHGARVSESSAFERVHILHRAIACGLPAETRLRMVAFSWPTCKSIRVIRDFRLAHQGIQPHCYSLGWLISRIDPQVRVSLVGFSLGAEVVAGGLHVLGGGQLGRMALEAPVRAAPTRVALWAAGEHNHWLLPGEHHGRALEVVDRMVVFTNHCDPVLKRYHLVVRNGCPVALGYAGLACPSGHAEICSKIQQYDATQVLGFSHSLGQHIAADCVLARTRDCLLWREELIELPAGPQ